MSPASAATASGSVFGAVVVTSTSRSSSRASSSLRGNRRFARLPDRASGRVAIGAGGATTAAAVSEMFVRAASRRVSGLSSRLTGRGVVVAAARFSGANGDDHVRRDPQVEFFGGDESDAPVAAAGARRARGRVARRGTPGGTRGAPTSQSGARRQAGVRPPAPEYRAAAGGEAWRARGGRLGGAGGQTRRRALRARRRLRRGRRRLRRGRLPLPRAHRG